MVMDASGKGMVCRPCAGLAPKRAESSTHMTAREQFAKPKSPALSKGRYACSNCRFRFSSAKPVDHVSCPYCGSRRISTPEENSADALLKAAGSRDYDF